MQLSWLKQHPEHIHCFYVSNVFCIKSKNDEIGSDDYKSLCFYIVLTKGYILFLCLVFFILIFDSASTL